MDLFLDSHLDFFKEKLDAWTFKKPPIDLVDGPVYGFALKFINKKVSPLVPDDLKPEFHEAMDLVVAGDYDDAGAEAIDVVVDLVNDWEKLPAGVKEVVLGVLGIAKGVLAGLD